jgi:hypothetical protein
MERGEPLSRCLGHVREPPPAGQTSRPYRLCRRRADGRVCISCAGAVRAGRGRGIRSADERWLDRAQDECDGLDVKGEFAHGASTGQH